MDFFSFLKCFYNTVFFPENSWRLVVSGGGSVYCYETPVQLNIVPFSQTPNGGMDMCFIQAVSLLQLNHLLHSYSAPKLYKLTLAFTFKKSLI